MALLNTADNCSSQRPTAAARASAPSPAPDSNARNHTPSTSLRARLLTRLRQRLQQPLPVLVILEDGLSPVAPIHHLIDCPRILNAHLPSHAPRLLLSSLRGQQNNTISLTDGWIEGESRPRFTSPWLPRRAPPAAQPGAAAPPRALSRPRSACRLAGAAQAFPRHNGQSAPDRGPSPARP